MLDCRLPTSVKPIPIPNNDFTDGLGSKNGRPSKVGHFSWWTSINMTGQVPVVWHTTTMLLSLSLAALSAAITTTSAIQQPFSSQLPIISNAFKYDNELFSPVEDLNLLSADSFTSLTHPAFPKHSARIKKSTDFCDGTVRYDSPLP